MSQTFVIHHDADQPPPIDHSRIIMACGYVMDYPTEGEPIDTTLTFISGIKHPNRSDRVTTTLSDDLITNWYSGKQTAFDVLASVFGYSHFDGSECWAKYTTDGLGEIRAYSPADLAFIVLTDMPEYCSCGSPITVLRDIEEVIDAHTSNFFKTEEEQKVVREGVWSGRSRSLAEFVTHMMECRDLNEHGIGVRNSSLIDLGHFYHLMVKVILADHNVEG